MSDHDMQFFTVRMTRAELDAAEAASGEIEYLLSNVADVFDLLQRGMSLGFLDTSQPSVIISVCEIARRALQAAAETEGVRMTDLSSALRKAGEDAP